MIALMRKLARSLLWLPLFSFLAPGLCPAGQLTVEQVLQQMEAFSDRLVDLQADFVQTKVMKLFDEQIVSKGKFYFRNPDKLVMDTQTPEHQQLIINYNHVWLHYPELKQVHELSLNNSKGLSALFVGFGGSVKNISQQFKVSLENVVADPDGKLVYTLSLEPIEGSPAASPALGIARVVLSVREGFWYPVCSQIVQKNGDKSIYEYSNHKVNRQLAETRFTFKLPQGTEVITYGEGSGASH